ncbi:ester cyclase [Streptomyces sp. NPDC005811]|uniref:ester cyclase n=1 Tax=Streptomyces sp. NPDC005811 TaxID=3154565 RepID=UPI003401EC63
MSVDIHTNLVRRFYEALEKADYTAVTSMFHEDFVFYNQIDTPHPGPEGFIAEEKKNIDAFRGIRMTVERTVAEGDRVGAFVVVEGNQTGEFRGLAPAGAHLRFSMFNLFTFKDRRIIEKRAHYNTQDILNQLKVGTRA